MLYVLNISIYIYEFWGGGVGEGYTLVSQPKFSCAQCASTYIGSTGRCCELELQNMLGGVIEQGLGWLTLRIRPSASMRKGVMSVWCWITSVF